jgi:AcrR family transcriptional regulator
VEETIEERKKRTKGERTRETILNAALPLFIERGYTATTLRDIAAAAGCSLGLTYRYFDSKEQLVLTLYERLAMELEQEVDALPVGSLASRFGAAMRADIGRMTPYRSALGALFGAAFAPESEVSLLGEKASNARQRVQAAFRKVVEGATDIPGGKLRDDLGALLYAAHLLLALYWLQDRTPEQRATRDMLTFAEETLGRTRLLLRIPLIARLLTDLARRVAPVTQTEETAPKNA